MEKFKQDSKDDILDQPYKGPGPVVASAGYVALSHLLSTIIGFVALGALGSLAAKQTVAVKEAFSKFSAHHVEHSSGVKKLAGYVVGFVPKIADKIANEVVGIGKKVSRNRVSSKPVSEVKLAAFMFAGGIGGAAGWIASTIWGVMKGGHEGNIGKRQFDRAKAEIKDLRERNDDLEKINDELHAKYVEAATQKETAEVPDHGGSNAVQSAEVTHHQTTHQPDSKTNHKMQHETPERTIHAQDVHPAEHHGKLHGHAPHEQAAHAHA